MPILIQVKQSTLARQPPDPFAVVHDPSDAPYQFLLDDILGEILHRLDIIVLSLYGRLSKGHAATALLLLKERVKHYTLPFFATEASWIAFFVHLKAFES
jgi:hypothetical protein